MTVRIAVVGAGGRMGTALVRLAREHDLTVVRAIGLSGVGEDVGVLAGVGKLDVSIEHDVSALASGGFEVAIDFSNADALPRVAATVAATGAALVSGTTGLTPLGERALGEASNRAPVLWEPNLSVGVQVLSQLLRQAILSLGEAFDVEIVETHHRSKVDAPSGTALRLAEVAREARGGAELRHGRAGRPGERKRDEIGVHAVRGGDVIGDHSIHLLGKGERIELVHRATNRDLFAHGALRAAAWIAGKPAGRYTLSQVLALS